MKNLRKALVVTLAICTLVFAKQTADPKAGIQALKTSFHLDDPDWQFEVYPVDNFGVGTGYSFIPGKPTQEKDFICATFGCLSVTPAPTVGSPEWLTVNGYAEVANGGALNIHSDSKSSFGTGIVLPGIMKLIKADFNADFSKNVTVDITIPGGTRRMLDRRKFENYIGPLPPTDLLKKTYNNGTLDYVLGDLVVSSMTMNIKVDASKNVKADATLTQAKGILDSNASLNMDLKNSGNGSYTLTVSKPVILAYLHRRQPAAGQSAAQVGWADWAPVSEPIMRKQ
jgi:hypothetical protein